MCDASYQADDHVRPRPNREFQEHWTLLLGAFLGILIGFSSAYFYTTGVFMKPLQEEFGWTRGEASLSAVLAPLCVAATAPFVGQMLDRFGPVRMAGASLTGLAICFVLLAYGTSGLMSYLLLTLLLCLAGVGTNTFIFTHALVHSFEKRRGAALGIALAATGAGAALYPFILIPHVAAHGWRQGYLLLALLIVALTPVVILLLRKQTGRHAGKQGAIGLATLWRSRAFRLLSMMFLLASFAVLGTIVHFVAMLSDAGLSPAMTGSLTAAIGLAAVVGRLAMGWLLDIVSPGRLTATIFLGCGAGMIILAVGGIEFALIGAVVVGLAVGAEGDILAFMVARHFPLQRYGAAYGGILIFFTTGTALGPGVAGYAKDLTGDYQWWLFAAAAMLGIAACLALRVPDVKHLP